MSSNETTSKKKKDKKATSKKDAKAKSAAAWGGFINISIITVIFLWILFPFYSWQLQVIFNQASCFNPGAGDCPLPSDTGAPPYCPGAKHGGCRETIQGPDMFTRIIDFFTHTLTQVYEIITGTVWIEVDKKVREMEKFAKQSGKKGDAGAATSGASASHKITHDKSKHKHKHKGGGKHAASRRGIFNDSTHANPYGAAVDMAESALKSSMGYDSKTAKNAQCCDDLLKWESLEIEKKCDTSFSLFDIEPFKSILPKEFGWPYSYLFDEPKKNSDGQIIPGEFEDTKYDPNGTASQSMPQRWVGAWFAKTQQRSWSASRGIWSKMLMLFYPFIHEDLDNIEVEYRLQNFIDAIEKQIEKQEKKLAKQEAAAKATAKEGTTVGSDAPQGGGGMISKQGCTDKCLKELGDIERNFKNIFSKFKAKFKADDGKNKGGKAGVREKLYQTIDSLGLFKSGHKRALEASGDENVWEYESKQQGGAKPKSKNVDNIYLDFFIAAIKPPEHGRRKSGKDKSASTVSFFNPFGGDERYWMRYIVTWFMPMMMMILVLVSVFTGFWFTAFSSVNRYSNFILPFFGGIWIALINMFAQPASVFCYMLFGARGKNEASANCPYDSGVYQMRKNMSQYFTLNMFLTLAIIVTHLGFALTASGSTGVGMVLSVIFPIYIGITLLLKLFHWLWNLA